MERTDQEQGESQQFVVVDVASDDTIDTVADKLVAAWQPNMHSKAVFDGVELYAGGGTTQDEIVARYNKAKGNA